MAATLFRAAEAWLGHRRGGLAMAAIGACAAFGAICGSSLATAATMAQVALPEMRAHGYPAALATGTLAAGGTLGILIPPSVMLVIYAILTEQNIAKLFVAALVPGMLAAVGYMLVIALYVRLRPGAGPPAARAVARAPARRSPRSGRSLLIFVVVFGGIYGGIVHADRRRGGRRRRDASCVASRAAACAGGVPRGAARDRRDHRR